MGYQADTGLRSLVRNHPSSLANRQVVTDYVVQEAAAGRIVGPLIGPLREAVHCSPIGLVPKGRGTGQWRMIVDLSHPSGRSVNDGISPLLCSLQYSSLDDALSFVKQLGQGTVLIKVDLRSAYRLVPVHPQDRHLFGINWGGYVYVDQALPFGLRSAPKLFTAVADAIGWALWQAGITLHIHYLDDFLFFVPPSAHCGQAVLAHVLGMLEWLGVPVAHQKIEGPAPVVSFLGVTIDTIRFELRLPDDKIRYIQGRLRRWIGRRSGDRSDFESLLGHLSHAASVVRQGRIFLRQLFIDLSAARPPCRYVHLSEAARADLRWWACFLVHWNGHMFFHDLPVPSAHIYTDASGNFGCGGVWLPRRWFQLRWPPSWGDIDISVKELVPIVVAAALWGRHWRNLHIRFHSDNMSVVLILQNNSASNLTAHHLLRCLYFYAAFYQFEYSCEHVPGVSNRAADALSRGNLHVFHSLISQAVCTEVPAAVLQMFVQQPDWGSARWIPLFSSTLLIP